MNINLANIDFAPGQGGGGEAVIRELSVTENGTYRAPSGVDGYSPVNVNVSGGGGSVTPEEQAALDMLVDSSKGVLYTDTYESYSQVMYKGVSISGYSNALKRVFWDDLYIIDIGANLYKLNRDTYKFDFINSFGGMYAYPSLFEDKSGRLYWDGRELDLENGTMGESQITLSGLYVNDCLTNIFYGEYGVWILNGDYAYKFNESSQEFEEMPLNCAFGWQGGDIYCNLFKYDGHILGVYNSGNNTLEVTEYEDHIDVADVTGVYFNMPSSYGTDACYKATKDGDLYYVEYYNAHKYDKSSGDWIDVSLSNVAYPIYGSTSLVSDNVMFSIYNSQYLTYLNLGSTFNASGWINLSNVAVDLTSNQTIDGLKKFDTIEASSLHSEEIYSQSYINIATLGNITNRGNNVVFLNNQGNETILKNGRKNIATVDQTFVNSTHIPYGTDGDNIGYVSGSNAYLQNFNTHTYRMFRRNGNNWYEFDGTSTLIPVSFGMNFYGTAVFNSPTMTIMLNWNDANQTYNTYMWNDANTRWDVICSSNDVGPGDIWFDGDDFRRGNDYKLAETGGVWSWVSDPLVNNIYEYYYKFGYKNGEVYAYSDNDWYLYKYDKVNCSMDRIGFVNAGSRLYSYYGEMFFNLNTSEVYIIDLSKVDPQNPNEEILGDMLFKTYSSSNVFIGATDDRLWYWNASNEMCSSYQNIYETPEVPASNGTYSLKATVLNGQVTYSWVLDV